MGLVFRFRIILLLLLSTLSVERTYAQAVSNEGTEFWTVFPTHVPATLNGGFRPLANYSIFITGKQASSGVVSVGTWQQRFTLAAGNTVIEVPVPRNDAYIPEQSANQVLSNMAIRVQVDPGQPKIVVYGHIFAGARSAASLILPKEALGQQYYSLNYRSGNTVDGGHNYIAVIASEPNTRIFLRLGTRDLVPGGILLQNVGDVYQYLSFEDLTGTNVFVDPQSSGCKQFAMFAGTTNSAITTLSGCSGNVSSDPLYQQNYPVDSWGRSYGFVPYASFTSPNPIRSRGNFIRILAKENNTQVLMNGFPLVTLNAGQFYQSRDPSNQPAFISANNPIAVAQYALTQSCQGGGRGDPDMVILNPIEYNIKNITVYSSTKENISENYVNVVIPTLAAPSFRINGQVPAESFRPLDGAPQYSYVRLDLSRMSTQTFNLAANDGFNAIAYGFGEVESYSYSAGTNLASNQSITAVDPATLSEINGACIGEELKFRLTLTSPATKLTWQLDPNETPVTETNPTPRLVQRNGVTIYEYLYPSTRSYPTSGEKSIAVTAEYSSTSGCILDEQEITIDFQVYDPPEALFSASATGCTDTEIAFTDESTDGGDPLTEWEWDFGDGTTSDKQNPVHNYIDPGTYTVRLRIQNSTSCESSVYEQQILIRGRPDAVFTMSQPGCYDTNIRFSDLSTSAEGEIVNRVWDFGDSTMLIRDDGLPFDHQFPGSGVYVVKLTVSTEYGCDHTFEQTLAIDLPSLEAGPDLFILRGGSIQFDIQATGTNLTYNWTPSGTLSADNVKNPIASPSTDTRYSVTVISEEGCELTDDLLVSVVEKPIIPNTFTPNGDGANDVWNILYLDTYPGVTVNIFNRFGVKIYSSFGYSNPWDGLYNGEPLPTGTYYYVIKAQEGLPEFSGWVALIR